MFQEFENSSFKRYFTKATELNISYNITACKLRSPSVIEIDVFQL